MRKVVFLYFVILVTSIYLLKLYKSVPQTTLFDIPWKISSKIGTIFGTLKSHSKKTIKTHVEASEILEENKKLKLENIDLRLKLQNYFYLKEENEKLRALLGLKSYLEKTITAEVITWIGEYWEQKYILNRGKKDGIEEGMAVIGYNGIIGMVVKVEDDRSIAISNTDPSFAVHVEDYRSKVKGILKGAGHFMKLHYIPQTADVKPGDLLVATGVDNIFPPGVVVGRIVSVEKRIDSKFLDVKVLPTDLMMINKAVIVYKRSTP